MFPRILALALVAWCVSAHAADLIPIEDFARPEAYSQLEMSPDGEYVGFIREHESVRRLCFADVATMKMTALMLPQTKIMPADRQVDGFEWLGAQRVLITSSGWAVVNRDGKNYFKDLGWQNAEKGVRYGTPDRLYGKVVHLYADDRTVLATNHRLDHGREAMQYPEVTKLNTVTGLGTTVAQNPGSVVRWIADTQGCVRVGVSIKEGEESVLYRASEKDVWRTLVTGQTLPFDPKAFSEDGTSLYVFSRSETCAGGLYRFDLEKKELGEAIWKNPVYEPSELVRDPSSLKIVGVRLVAEQPRTQWFDQRFVAFQAAVDKVLPGTINALSGFSRDLSRVLVKSFSDREPETAYVFNTASGEVREIGKTRGWINPEQMAQVRPISYLSRDGIRIFGYLTIPIAAKPENLPLVVVLRGGLRGRSVWGFDPLVQLLANRGYAVLQMNCRGSSGYGWGFRRKGDGETGGKVQADIEDGTRWAIAKKVADPKRIAVVGTMYGGFAVLHSLGKSTVDYTCGVVIAPIADWADFLSYWIHPAGFVYRRQPKSEDVLVDETMSEDVLKLVSPVNYASEIKAPVLVINRESQGQTWARQAQSIGKALEKAGRAPETLNIPEENGMSQDEKARLAEYKAIEAFLAKHLGAGATGKAAAPVPALAQ